MSALMISKISSTAGILDERSECDLVRVSQARGREVSAKVAVKEQISVQPRTISSSSTDQTNFSANNINFYSRPSEDLSKRYSRRDSEIKGYFRTKRKGYKLDGKKYVGAHTACDDHPSNGSIAAPSVHASNSIVTVEKRVAEAECTVPMANGENAAQTSGTCSDRTTSDVEKILHNPIHRRPFQQFLEQQFCAENINFYVAVEEYRAIPDSEMEKRSKVARQIYERHFTANSIEPVNIDNSTSKSIRDAVSAQQFSAQLYDVAQYQIFHLLKYDCWPRYLRAGGVAPTFDDQATGEEHPGPSTQSSQVCSFISAGFVSSSFLRYSLLFTAL
ncbi:unnamed protein product [Anisakis simplex]|uniref:RGS domain-containing protein n=1 Tax=Anisakis simplex TaxID=6269 RepID=A0A0M3JWL3_ANISI|nr:unnamed protein product [Anisakis simplex]